MATLGISPSCDRNELHRHLRNELDDGNLLSQGSRAAFGWTAQRGGTDVSAPGTGSGSTPDLLEHLVLDVPPEDLLENLTFARTISFPEIAVLGVHQPSGQLLAAGIDAGLPRPTGFAETTRP